MQIHDDMEGFLDGLAAFFDSLSGAATPRASSAPKTFARASDRRLARWAGTSADLPGTSAICSIDTADALGRFMRNGVPDAGALRDIASELDQYRRDACEGASSRLVSFGNMSESLIADRNPAAAIALEGQWHRLTRDLPFFTVCGYHASCFHDSVPDVWSRACAEHWAVSHTSNRWSSRT